MAKKKQLTLKDIKKINRNFSKWSETFVKIVDNEGKQVPFKLNKQQMQLYKNMEKFNLCGKGRQLGITSFACCYALYLCCVNPNTNTAILADCRENTHIIFDEKLKKLYYSIPDAYKKMMNFEIRRDNKQELLFSNGSRVSVKTASHKELFRGSTMQFIHCSEFAFWNEYAQTKGLLGLQQALAKNKNSKLLIESTSNGLNEFYNLYKESKKPNSAWKFFFFPWFMDTELYKYEYELAEEWWRNQSVNKGQRFSYDVDCDKEEKMLFDKYGVKLYQLCWRRWKLAQGMSEEEFRQEYPSFPEESFVRSGKNLFDQSKILKLLENVTYSLQEEEIISDVNFPVDLVKYINKNLFIYKLPIKGVRMYMGVDTSAGVGQDRSAISIFDEAGEQVCVFFHDKIKPFKFAEIVNLLGHYYNYAFAVVEKNNVGITVLERLSENYLYENLYRQRTFDKFNRKRLTPGWATTSVTKNIMVQDFLEMFSKDLIRINDKHTLEEMQVYEEKSTGATGNKRGDQFHDDIIDSCFLAIQGLKTNKYYVDL